MAAEGLLLQLDGSHHHWLGPDLPKLTLPGAIDDATSKVPAATFRNEEDTAGYLEILRDVARTAANAVLASFLPGFKRRFGVPATEPVPVWRPWPDGLDPDHVFALKYRLKVAKDDTVRVASQSIQLPPAPRPFVYAGKMVEVHLRLDGSVARPTGVSAEA
jgi:hypothetical protein